MQNAKPLSLSAGGLLGPYEILAPVGAGGMGEVYRARDTRLDRTVAVKVLPAEVSANSDLRHRFEREARAISRLNHPHICTLYDVGHQGDIHFLVMEYLEGETLAERLRSGALPLDELLRYAIQIANALTQAHRHGLLHRDLKPGNIMLTKSGAKLLDFGLAKLEPDAGGGLSHATASAPLTEQGTILGTVQYMAPEQLEGRKTDARTDIFAFGSVLYEMATGRKAFAGDSAPRVIASILAVEPPGVSTLQPAVPAALDRSIARCLAKDPDERWQTASDLKAELEWVGSGAPASGVAPVPPPARRRELPVWVAAAAGVLVAVGFAGAYFRGAPATAPLLRLSISPPPIPVTDLATAISPNGRYIAFGALEAFGTGQLWIRHLDSMTTTALPGTETAALPFWSPDSRFIAFFAEGKLKRIEVGDRADPAPPQTLCDAPEGRGGTWSRDGVIVFSPNLEETLYRVSATGGRPVPITALDRERRETAHRWPDFLPDGRHFLYWVRSGDEAKQGVYIGSLDDPPQSQERRLLLNTAANALYAAPGYVLFERERTLMAQAIDPIGRQLLGEPRRVANEISDPRINRVSVTVSTTGLLAYQSRNPTLQLVWFDRAGTQTGVLQGTEDAHAPQISPDGSHVIFDRPDRQNRAGDLWMIELRRGTVSRLTTDPSYDWRAVWAPDGRRIIFASSRNGPMNLFQKLVNGPDEQLLFRSERRLTATDWSRDGRFVAYEELSPDTEGDVWILPVEGNRAPIPFLRSTSYEHEARFSPDVRWMAYTSNESGTSEVYVQGLSDGKNSGPKIRVSGNGGSDPRWRSDGRELFYVARNRKLLATQVNSAATFELGTTSELFEVPAPYSVTADGQRFLVPAASGDGAAVPVTVVVNWTAALQP